MVAADERVAVELPLAEQSALMGAAAVEGAPFLAGPNQNDIRPICGERERPRALELTDAGDANERFRLHKSRSQLGPDCLELVWSRPAGTSALVRCH